MPCISKCLPCLCGTYGNIYCDNLLNLTTDEMTTSLTPVHLSSKCSPNAIWPSLQIVFRLHKWWKNPDSNYEVFSFICTDTSCVLEMLEDYMVRFWLNVGCVSLWLNSEVLRMLVMAFNFAIKQLPSSLWNWIYCCCIHLWVVHITQAEALDKNCLFVKSMRDDWTGTDLLSTGKHQENLSAYTPS